MKDANVPPSAQESHKKAELHGLSENSAREHRNPYTRPQSLTI
jgi:hypothetical protein